MKEEYNTEKRRGWIVWLSVLALMLVGVGIFFYYTFFRQTRSELIEAVPTDALFVFEINDNEAFQKGVAPLAPYFTETFALDVLPAYEDVYAKLSGQYDLTISGHPGENGPHTLFNTHIEKNVFKKLLRALSIDPANFTSFEHYKIYTYGTKFKSLKFVYFNHILSISDDMELLKKSIIQHTHPKNLLDDKTFKGLYELSAKNMKQNWVLIQIQEFGKHLATFLTEETYAKIKKVNPFSDWSAFQLRIGRDEVTLAGYTPASDKMKAAAQQSKHNFEIPEQMLPFNTEWYLKRTGKNHATCTFSLAGDSSRHHQYLVVMQDTVHRVLVPFGSEERAELFRNQHPSGIYPVTDSTFMGAKDLVDAATYPLFVERNGACLFAPSLEALTLYYKMLNGKGSLVDNRYYKFSNSNAASRNLMDFTFYNQAPSAKEQDVLSEKGKSSFLGRNVAIFSANCTDVTDKYAAVNIYVMLKSGK